jgi:hypothetical protein
VLLRGLSRRELSFLEVEAVLLSLVLGFGELAGSLKSFCLRFFASCCEVGGQLRCSLFGLSFSAGRREGLLAGRFLSLFGSACCLFQQGELLLFGLSRTVAYSDELLRSLSRFTFRLLQLLGVLFPGVLKFFERTREVVFGLFGDSP